MLSATLHGKPLLYLDTAATALKPQSVLDAMDHYYRETCSTVHRGIYTLAMETTTQYEAVRTQVQEFLNASSDREIIFTKGTTEAINLVATTFAQRYLNAGDEVLISEIEHHANIVPWQMACMRKRAILKVIPVNDRAEIDLEAYQRLLSSKTKLVSVGHISNALGTLHPVKKMIGWAHSVGAYVLVDGAQAAPQIPLDVRDLDADFYTFSGHKTYGPTGVGVLYGKEKLLQELPPYQGGGDMIAEVTFEKTTYQEPPLKFEAGTPMIGEVIGLGAALKFLQEVGMEEIYTHEQSLLLAATQALQGIKGLRILGTAKEKGALVTFDVEGVHPLDLGTLLDLCSIAVRTGHLCAQPALRRFGVEGATRLSFGLYNTLEDVERVVEAIQTAVDQCRSQ